MLNCCIPVRKSRLVNAPECLHPASIDVLVEMVLLQKPSHCIIGAMCCCMVSARSTIGKMCSRAVCISISRSMVSKNFSKSWETPMTCSSVYLYIAACNPLYAAAFMADFSLPDVSKSPVCSSSHSATSFLDLSVVLYSMGVLHTVLVPPEGLPSMALRLIRFCIGCAIFLRGFSWPQT